MWDWCVALFRCERRVAARPRLALGRHRRARLASSWDRAKSWSVRQRAAGRANHRVRLPHTSGHSTLRRSRSASGSCTVQHTAVRPPFWGSDAKPDSTHSQLRNRERIEARIRSPPRRRGSPGAPARAAACGCLLWWSMLRCGRRCACGVSVQRTAWLPPHRGSAPTSDAGLTSTNETPIAGGAIVRDCCVPGDVP